jgi:hypothetical protein
VEPRRTAHPNDRHPIDRQWERRLVFEPYTKDAHTQIRAWIAERDIFADTGMGSASYDGSVILAARGLMTYTKR